MQLKGKRVLVFCSSSDSVSEIFDAAARRLGELIAREGCELVFGGTDAGLMGILARSAAEGGARVTGVIPEKMHKNGQTFKGCSEVRVSRDLHERKSLMHQISDILICLPGGLGSLDELAESLALRQLRCHDKPLVLVNTAGYFDLLLAFFEKMRTEGFSREESRCYFQLAADADTAIECLKGF